MLGFAVLAAGTQAKSAEKTVSTRMARCRANHTEVATQRRFVDNDYQSDALLNAWGTSKPSAFKSPGTKWICKRKPR